MAISAEDHEEYKNRYLTSKARLKQREVEGNELNALKSIDLKKYQPKLICVEIHNFGMIHKNYDDYYKRTPVYKFLNNRGYKILWKNEFSFIFRK